MEPIRNFDQLTAYLQALHQRKRIVVVCASDPNTEYAIALLSSDTGIRSIVSSYPLDYETVAEAMGTFADEEQGIETYLLVSQEGMKDLREDDKLLGNEMLSAELLSRGVIGSIAGAYIIISNKLNGTNNTRQAFLLKKEAITAFLKRDVNLETARNVLAKKTLFSADEHYVCGIENGEKVVAITHTNDHLGQLFIRYRVDAQTDGTYDMKVLDVYPAKFSVNTLGYNLAASAPAITFDQVIQPGVTAGWSPLTIGSTIENVGSTPILTVVQVLTADNKTKYAGTVKVL